MTVTLYAGCLKDEILEPAVDFRTDPSFSDRNTLLVPEVLGIDPGESYAGSMETDPALASCATGCAPTSTGHLLHWRRA